MKALRVLGVACACVLLAAAPPRTPIYGYTPSAATASSRSRIAFLDLPSAAGALEATGSLAALPHYAGSTGDYKLALYVRDKLQESGFDTSIETLTARVDIPNKLTLELVSDRRPPGGPNAGKVPAYAPVANAPRAARRWKRRPTPLADPESALRRLRLRSDSTCARPPDPADPDTANPAVGLPFIAGSADGNVVAPLVYAGHGTPADYALLDAHSIDASGAVVLMRLRRRIARRPRPPGPGPRRRRRDPLRRSGRRRRRPRRDRSNGPWRPAYSVQRGSVGAGHHDPGAADLGHQRADAPRRPQGPDGIRAVDRRVARRYPFARGPASCT